MELSHAHTHTDIHIHTDITYSTEGNLWIAMYASNRIMVFSPSGAHLKDIVLPAYSPTCTTWGGADFDIIFAASGKDKREGGKETGGGDEGGHMFKYKPVGSRGGPKFEFAG